ncbi:MAG: ribosome hibernation-promoting factor, HPF/YfiA family [Desulfococcaceae bacterium]
MQTSVTFRNIDASEHLKSYVGDKLNRFDRFLDTAAEANVVLSVEKHRHIAEIHITGGGLNVKGKEETTDMYSAIDRVLDKMEKQIKKSKQKGRERRGAAPRAGAAAMLDELGRPGQEPEGEILVRTVDYKPMDAEEAVMQLDLSQDNFLVFTNARTEEINVVYRRNDGHYGLIQPNR